MHRNVTRTYISREGAAIQLELSRQRKMDISTTDAKIIIQSVTTIGKLCVRTDVVRRNQLPEELNYRRYSYMRQWRKDICFGEWIEEEAYIFFSQSSIVIGTEENSFID